MIPHFLTQRKVEQIYFGMSPNQTEQQYLRTIQCLCINAYLHSNRRSILGHNMSLHKFHSYYLNKTRPNTLPNTLPNPESIGQVFYKETETFARNLEQERE